MKFVNALSNDEVVGFDKSTFVKMLNCFDETLQFWDNVWELPEYQAISEKLERLEFDGDSELTALSMQIGRMYAQFIINMPCVKVIFDK